MKLADKPAKTDNHKIYKKLTNIWKKKPFTEKKTNLNL